MFLHSTSCMPLVHKSIHMEYFLKCPGVKQANIVNLKYLILQSHLMVAELALVTGLYHRDVLWPGSNSYTKISVYLFPLYHSADQTFLRMCPGPLSAGKWKEGQDDPGYGRTGSKPTQCILNQAN